ncbi:MAG: DUF4124 domain-containing protein [Sideroxyarcus sp.]
MDILRILIALFLLFLATIAEGEAIFKWVDEQGVTHYSAGSPKDKKAQQVKVQPASPAVEGASQSPSLREWEANENMKKRKQRQEQQEEADNQLKEEKARRCEIAKERFGILSEQGRVYSTNEKGEREYWDDNTREVEIKKAKEAISNNC